MNAVIFGFPGNERLAESLSGAGLELGRLHLAPFPDGETHLRLDTEVKGRDVVLVCSLDRPDEKLLPLVFAAGAARELGARRIGLVAPYLAYLRQDARFRAGEAITSKHFAQVLNDHLDWLLCVDPHLHRYKSMRELYSIPATVVHAAPDVAQWIKGNVDNPVILGPDSESEQWVSEVARLADAPFAVFEKLRKGDRDVEITMPHAHRWREHTPVLVDDIISSGGTMMAAVRLLTGEGLRAPVCIGIHAVFAQGAYAKLQVCGAADVITCNTVFHTSNAIDVHPAIAERVRNLLT